MQDTLERAGVRTVIIELNPRTVEKQYSLGRSIIYGDASNREVLERAGINDKRAIGVWGTPRVPAAIAAALKRRFDPRDVLAPGRMPVT